ncbi:hypothetical protein [Spirillospora sp. CA-294931]|uniref:hypothetical protein n=1 Tax=Spirillospora sp. CA-294931 TaxID=3240042 RepID=UPI003D91EAD2
MNTPRTLAVVTATAAALTAGASAATATASGSDPKKVTIKGSARMYYAPDPKDDVRFTLDATATYTELGQDPMPATAGGTFKVSHRVDSLNITVWAEARVDCVRASGRVATVTAVVYKTSPELQRDWMGRRLGFTIADFGRKNDQMGSIGPREEVARCLKGTPYVAPAPFSLAQRGGFTLKHDLPPMP